MEKAIEYTLKATKKRFTMGRICMPSQAIEFARKFWRDDINIYESSFIILLNNHSDVIGYAKISQGGVSGTVVDPKIVAKYAIDSLATGVIFIHNHPSGGLLPSRADDLMTEKLKNGLALLDIKLVDSMIITDKDCRSIM